MEHLTITEAPAEPGQSQRIMKALEQCQNAGQLVANLAAAFVDHHLDDIRLYMQSDSLLQENLDALRDAVGEHRNYRELFQRAVIGD
jgi:hypothetical protein